MGGVSEGRVREGLRMVHAYDGNTKRAALLVLTTFLLVRRP
jgi:prophage maintenance system killer protein